ncbi:acetyltransferase [Bacilli bacterium]|nr:acetyltransferase [Bacilli bacterium]GHU40391.1 acetyltransferase [Bacilli bacterium]
MTRLETERLMLRPWLKTDAEDLYCYASDPDIGPITGWPVHTSVENSLEIIDTVFQEPGNFAIYLKSENRVVGSISLKIGQQSSLGLSDQEAEFGYWIGKPFWGQGLMPEAVEAVIDYALNTLDLTDLWCGYYEGNLKSRRVQEKCGFHYHHTEYDVAVPLMHEIRTLHVMHYVGR